VMGVRVIGRVGFGWGAVPYSHVPVGTTVAARNPTITHHP